MPVTKVRFSMYFCRHVHQGFLSTASPVAVMVFRSRIYCYCFGISLYHVIFNQKIVVQILLPFCSYLGVFGGFIERFLSFRKREKAHQSEKKLHHHCQSYFYD
jgi:hypothetical protein